VNRLSSKKRARALEKAFEAVDEDLSWAVFQTRALLLGLACSANSATPVALRKRWRPLCAMISKLAHVREISAETLEHEKTKKGEPLNTQARPPRNAPSDYEHSSPVRDALTLTSLYFLAASIFASAADLFASL
jgi:hypothetical protein